VIFFMVKAKPKKRLKIEKTNIDIIIEACADCPLREEVGPGDETWFECSITNSFASYYSSIYKGCPLPDFKDGETIA